MFHFRAGGERVKVVRLSRGRIDSARLRAPFFPQFAQTGSVLRSRDTSKKTCRK